MAEVASALARLVTMRTEQHRLFTAFDDAYKRSLKSQTTKTIGDLDKVRDHLAYVIEEVANLWGTKLDDDALNIHGRRVSQVFKDFDFRTDEALDAHYRQFITYLNAVQEIQPEESISQAAQYYNQDLQKIEQQIAQSRKGKSSDDGGSQDGGPQDGGSQDGGEVTPVVPE